MAKLKCEAHQRRVVIFDQKMIHRNGDGSKCLSMYATIGDKKYNSHYDLKSN